MTPGATRYHGCHVALLTQHGKERVIAPVLEAGLGCTIELVSGVDTDQLGTFTREIPRIDSQRETARTKARKGMELAGTQLGLASEGSFGADPYTGLLPWNIELLIWIDDTAGVEVVGMAEGAARNAHIQSGDWSTIADFAERQGFPAHQLIIRPEGESDRRIYKDIDDWDRLKSCYNMAVAQSSNGEVFVESDLRAFANPSRMARIGEAAADLLQRLLSRCPACEAPGFWISQRVRGLPCASCRLPTSVFQSEIWACQRCKHEHAASRSDLAEADPAHCDYCNP